MATKHEAQHKKKPRTKPAMPKKGLQGKDPTHTKGQDFSRMAGLLKKKMSK
jgi:hypothetical protein